MNRWYGSLTAPEVPSSLGEDAILCLPIGSYEQHGPHLPLHTDTVIAERFTTRMADRYSDQHNLLVLPAVPYGLSLEHIWSPGTISLRVGVLSALLDAVVSEYIRATPARRLLIVNGHGGNRGILEAVAHELRATYRIRICVVHPGAMSAVPIDSALPEAHAGIKETSIMLSLAPDDVRLDRLPGSFVVDHAQRTEIERQVRDRGATWPWLSEDSRISVSGIIGGDPRLASADLGQAVVAGALDACGIVLKQL